MGERNKILLVYQSETVKEFVLNQCASRNWNLETSQTLAEAIFKTQNCTFPVIVIEIKYLDNNRFNFFKYIESLEASYLIALVSKKDLKKPTVRKLIYEYFFAFFEIPLRNGEFFQIVDNIIFMQSMKSSHAGLPSLVINDIRLESTTIGVQKLIRDIQKVAEVDAPVYINGETGTGKELAAKAIHYYSKRSKGPFVAVNCGAIPRELMQSAFFGYEKGAFTDAANRQIGHIEAASNGTLFLDEIGDLPLDMQVCLLRFLESHRLHRLGGLEEIFVDVRVISATHVDLLSAIADGIFREDLYYRINVLNLRMPPLRERLGDIEVLVESIIKRFSNEQPRNFKGVSNDAIEHMKQYNWPGNIRELVNRLRRAMVMCKNGWVTPDDLNLTIQAESKKPYHLERVRDLAEKRTLQTALIRSNNNISKTARELGISRVTLYRLIEKHGIDREKLQNSCYLVANKSPSNLKAMKKDDMTGETDN